MDLAKHTTLQILGCILLASLVLTMAQPPGLTKPSHATCKIKKYKHCYNLEHVCPKLCPESCHVECASCKPICGPSSPGDDGGDDDGEDTPSAPVPPVSPPPPTPSVPSSTPPVSPPPPTPTPSVPSPTPPVSPPPPTPTPSVPSPTPPVSPPPPTPTPSVPSPTPPVSPPPPTPTPSVPSPTPPVSPPPPTPTPSVPSPTPPVSPPPPTPTPSVPSPTPPVSPPPPSPTPAVPSPHDVTPTPPTPAMPSPPDVTPTPHTPSVPSDDTPTTPLPPYSPPATPIPSVPSPTPTPPGSTPETPTPSVPTPPGSNPTTPTPSVPTPPGSNPTTPTPSVPTPSPSVPVPSSPNSPPYVPPSSPTPTPPSDEEAGAGVRKARCKKKDSPCYGVEYTCPVACPRSCEVDCVTCKPLCNCDKPGSVCQDPRFIGGDGLAFYFHGKKDSNFCLISDPNLHINAHFIGKRRPGMARDFTWVQSIAILFGTHRFYVGALKTATWDDSVDRISASFDGNVISLPQLDGATWTSSPEVHPQVSVKRVNADTNNFEVEVEGLLKITARVVPITMEDSRIHGYDVKADDCLAHLDLGFKFQDLSDNVDGVLGQTYRSNYVSRVKIGVHMPVMGGEREYQTTGLFAPDCSAARFTGNRGINGGRSKMELPEMSCASGVGGKGVVCKK